MLRRVGFCVQLSVSGIFVDSILGFGVLCIGGVKVKKNFSGDFQRVKTRKGAFRNQKVT